MRASKGNTFAWAPPPVPREGAPYPWSLVHLAFGQHPTHQELSFWMAGPDPVRPLGYESHGPWRFGVGPLGGAPDPTPDLRRQEAEATVALARDIFEARCAVDG